MYYAPMFENHSCIFNNVVYYITIHLVYAFRAVQKSYDALKEGDGILALELVWQLPYSEQQ